MEGCDCLIISSHSHHVNKVSLGKVANESKVTSQNFDPIDQSVTLITKSKEEQYLERVAV